MRIRFSIIFVLLVHAAFFLAVGSAQELAVEAYYSGDEIRLRIYGGGLIRDPHPDNELAISTGDPKLPKDLLAGQVLPSDFPGSPIKMKFKDDKSGFEISLGSRLIDPKEERLPLAGKFPNIVGNELSTAQRKELTAVRKEFVVKVLSIVETQLKSNPQGFDFVIREQIRNQSGEQKKLFERKSFDLLLPKQQKALTQGLYSVQFELFPTQFLVAKKSELGLNNLQLKKVKRIEEEAKKLIEKIKQQAAVDFKDLKKNREEAILAILNPVQAQALKDRIKQ